MKLAGESQSVGGNPSANATLFTTNPKFLGLNSSLHVERPTVVYFTTPFHIFLFLFLFYYYYYYYYYCYYYYYHHYYYYYNNYYNNYYCYCYYLFTCSVS